MLFKRQKIDWLLILVVVTGVFLYASYQPNFRLPSTMPADFMEPPSSPQQGAAEGKIAQAYWNCLVDNVQWKYGFGRVLPTDAPADFSLSVEPPAVAIEDAATRARYWRKAQHLWALPNIWKKAYEWDFSWTTNWIQDGGDALHRAFQHLGGN